MSPDIVLAPRRVILVLRSTIGGFSSQLYDYITIATIGLTSSFFLCACVRIWCLCKMQNQITGHSVRRRKLVRALDLPFLTSSYAMV